MLKHSQKRSLRDIIREKNPLNSASEYFNSKIKELMKNLRKSDGEIRLIISGDKKEQSLRDILKNSKSLFNKKEYINSFIVLDSFRERLGKASAICQSLNLDINTNYKDFFIKELADDEKQGLIEFRKKLDEELKTKAHVYNEFVKQAGLLDFFRSIFTQRGRALRAWEKVHGKEIEQMKDSLVKLFDLSYSTLEEVNNQLMKMSYALSVRDISGYSSASKKIVMQYNKYNLYFKKYYKDHIQKLIDDLQVEVPVVEEKRDTLHMTDEEQKQFQNESRDTLPEEAQKRDTVPGTPLSSSINTIEDTIKNTNKKSLNNNLTKEELVKKARENLLKLAKSA